MKLRFSKVLASASLGALSCAISGCAQAAQLTAPAPAPAKTPAPAQRPNIVLIVADDMGYSDLGCYGSEIATPNLDQLATGGLRFTRFRNAARCCPTRASLMTGLYPHQAGIGEMNFDLGLAAYQGELNNRCVTLAEALGSAGYSTYATGKWHLTRFENNKASTDTGKVNWPRQRGFDRYYGMVAGADSYFRPETLALDNERVQPTGENFYTTDAFSDYAVKVINEHGQKNQPKPFFFYVAYNAPHWPLEAPATDIARYKGRFDKGWDVLRQERLARMVKAGLVDPALKLPPGPNRWTETTNKSASARKMETYAAMVTRMDEGVGRIVASLKASGQYDNTLLIFLSDNGAAHEPAGYGPPWASLSNTPHRLYKHWIHEGGVATPFIVHWPSRIRERGALRAQPGHVMDLMPTFLEAAGAPYPKTFKGQSIAPMEGHSLLPAFNNSPIQRPPLFWEHEGNRALLDGDWKLVGASTGGRREGPWELYNIARDRAEENNRLAQEPQRAQAMVQAWEAWAERVHVKPYPKGRAGGAEDEGAPPNLSIPQLVGKALVIRCDVTPEAQVLEGVMLAQGGGQRGYALYLQGGKPVFAVRQRGQLYTAASPNALVGRSLLEARLEKDGTMTLAVSGTIVARGKAPSVFTQQPQDALSIGRDTKAAVGDYQAPNPFKGKVEDVQVTAQEAQ